MASFTRRVQFTAFQFNPTRGLIESDARDQNLRGQIAHDVPNLSVYDIAVSERSNRVDSFLEPQYCLTIVQHNFNSDGERSNVNHDLYPGEWLIEDIFAESGWRVVTSDELMRIIS